MRNRVRYLPSLVAAFVALNSASAQKPNPAVLNGIWHQTAVHIERPDSTVDRPPSSGMTIIYNGHFTQVYVAPAARGVQQAARPTSAEEKAARYDLLTANGGRFEMTDSTFILHYEIAKTPAQATATVTVRYRLHGDTLWQFTAARWPQDTTKMVRTTYTWVRAK
jgi:hypothetical protein